MHANEYVDLIKPILAITAKAGEITRSYFKQINQAKIRIKKDSTPVTEADVASQQIIEQQLQHIIPHYPILSEEGVIPDFKIRQQWQSYWCIDPLDGTRGFVEGNKQFTINIALIEHHQPVLGVIHAPMFDVFYYAIKNLGAYKLVNQNSQPQRLLQRKIHPHHWRWVIGGYHQRKWIDNLKKYSEFSVQRANSALKFGLIAEGKADLYPRLGPTSEWDTAAGQCLLNETGGIIVDFAGQSLQYNAKASVTNPEFFAIADATFLTEALHLFKQIRSE